MYNTNLKFNEFYEQVNTTLFSKENTIYALVGFSFLNWILEIIKWKILAKNVKKVTFLEATEQVLGSHTISLATPNRIGEYGGKALYFLSQKKRILLLNLIGNLYQLFATVLFGIVGLYFLFTNYEIEFDFHRLRFLAYLIGFSILIFVTNKNKKLFYFFDIEKVRNFVKNMRSSTHFKIGSLAILRYIVFSHQFYFLLMIFGVKTDYFILMPLIFSMYIIASFIPTFSFFDWAIKGSVAIYIFSLIGIPEITIFTITLLMWLLNFALPAIIGCYFVISYKTSKSN